MASEKKIETRLLAATTTNQVVDWGSPPLKKIYLVADAATVRIDFDQPTDAGSFPLPTANVIFEFDDISCNKLHVSTSSSTANLYMLGVR